MLMPSGDVAHDKDSRRKFNQEAPESLQHHRDDLAHSKRVASDAVLDFKHREKHQRKRASKAVRARQKTA